MRLEAAEWKATYRPFALIDGALLPLRERSPPACLPRLLTLTLVVRPVRRSRTKTSARLLVSWATRFDASDRKTTLRPSALMPPAFEPPNGSELRRACAPLLETLTRLVLPVRRSRTNASVLPLVSPATRFRASELNRTYRPWAVIAIA